MKPSKRRFWGENKGLFSKQEVPPYKESHDMIRRYKSGPRTRRVALQEATIRSNFSKSQVKQKQRIKTKNEKNGIARDTRTGSNFSKSQLKRKQSHQGKSHYRSQSKRIKTRMKRWLPWLRINNIVKEAIV